MEETQEKSLQREAVKIEIAAKPTPFAELDPELKLALRCISEKKGIDITALDLREIASFTEFFVIAGGANQRQVQAIADEINEQLKKQLGSRPVRIEGYTTGEWVLLDYGDFIVHVFESKAREFYDLARLWRDARRVEIPWPGHRLCSQRNQRVGTLEKMVLQRRLINLPGELDLVRTVGARGIEMLGALGECAVEHIGACLAVWIRIVPAV